MVNLSKRIDFKTKMDLQLADKTRQILKRENDKKNKLENINDLAYKHLVALDNEFGGEEIDERIGENEQDIKEEF